LTVAAAANATVPIVADNGRCHLTRPLCRHTESAAAPEKAEANPADVGPP